MAAVREGFLKDLSTDEMESAAQRLLKLPSFYRGSYLFEWDWRVASLVDREVGELTEPTNNISTVRRSTGHLLLVDGEQMRQIDGIRVDFDINTNPSNSSQRFGDEHLRSFFERVAVWHEELGSEVFSLIAGAGEER